MRSLQLPQPGLKPLSIKDEPNESKSGLTNMNASAPKLKLSADSQKKIKETDINWNQVPKANEAFCLDMYKNSAAPSMAGKKGDLFSGLNQTVKVNTKQKLKKVNLF